MHPAEDEDPRTRAGKGSENLSGRGGLMYVRCERKAAPVGMNEARPEYWGEASIPTRFCSSTVSYWAQPLLKEWLTKFE